MLTDVGYNVFHTSFWNSYDVFHTSFWNSYDVFYTSFWNSYDSFRRINIFLTPYFVGLFFKLCFMKM